MKRVTRAIPATDVLDLLEHPPRATLAFVRDGTIEALPVAFRLAGERCLFGVGPGTGTLPDRAKLLIDDGPWYFDLRGTWLRGPVVPSDALEGESEPLEWYELTPVKSVAWHYGSMRLR